MVQEAILWCHSTGTNLSSSGLLIPTQRLEKMSCSTKCKSFKPHNNSCKSQVIIYTDVVHSPTCSNNLFQMKAEYLAFI